jgi:hypothetical protein
VGRSIGVYHSSQRRLEGQGNDREISLSDRVDARIPRPRRGGPGFSRLYSLAQLRQRLLVELRLPQRAMAAFLLGTQPDPAVQRHHQLSRRLELRPMRWPADLLQCRSPVHAHQDVGDLRLHHRQLLDLHLRRAGLLHPSLRPAKGRGTDARPARAQARRAGAERGEPALTIPMACLEGGKPG